MQDAPIRSRSTIAGPLSGVIEALQNDNVSLATWLVRRYVAILKLFSPMMRVLEFDEEVRIWRFAHARTAQRAIGAETRGTGHTSGVSYLDHVATHRADFFPELWRARQKLWERRH